MADFVYKGEPVYGENGIVKYVRPVRGVTAPNGATYRGVLAKDSRGNDFVYNKFPNAVTPVTVAALYDSEGKRLYDALYRALFVPTI